MPEPCAPVSTPVKSATAKFQELSQQVSQRQILRAALKAAKVPDATIQKAVDQQQQQQQQTVYFEGYVYAVYTSPPDDPTAVIVVLSGDHDFYFPPNDPKFLPELLRAMNHPNFRVGLSTTITDSRPVINSLFVYNTTLPG